MAMTKTKRRQTVSITPAPDGLTMIDFFCRRLANRDTRSHTEFLADIRATQAAGRLANSATAALLDRLERAI